MKTRIRLIPALLALLLSACETTAPTGKTEVPSLVFQTPPLYPFELHRANITGSATVDFVVTSKGDVVNAYPVFATHPAFGVAAAAAVSLWKFKPGIRNGVAVNTHLQVPISFYLTDAEKVPAPPPVEAVGR